MITKYLKKADSMKSEVCGERGALAEWRGALERSACDITAIEQFTKQDLSKAKVICMCLLNLKYNLYDTCLPTISRLMNMQVHNYVVIAFYLSYNTYQENF